jgi:hypothetical protein
MMSGQLPPTARKWLRFWSEDPLKTVCGGVVNEKGRD